MAGGALAGRDEILRVERLTMRFGGLVAIDGLSFSARRGDITAIIGPNGAGKTTVFNCITGFYKPTQGRIALAHGSEAAFEALADVTRKGRQWSEAPGGALFLLERMAGFEIARKAKVARTFQNIRLFAGMTVLENLLVAQHNTLNAASGYTFGALLGSRRYARAEREAIERSAYWLAEIGLLNRADDPAGDLPYGAQRRLEIARALCTDPVLLCLDEPAAGLNPRKVGGVERSAPQNPRGARAVDPSHRARHGRGDGHLRPHRSARLRAQDCGRNARRNPLRPARHRRLSRRRR